MTGLSFLIIQHNSHGLIIWVLSTTVDCTWQESHDGIQCFPCTDLPNTHKYTSHTSLTIIHKHITKQHRFCWRKVLCVTVIYQVQEVFLDRLHVVCRCVALWTVSMYKCFAVLRVISHESELYFTSLSPQFPAVTHSRCYAHQPDMWSD